MTGKKRVAKLNIVRTGSDVDLKDTQTRNSLKGFKVIFGKL